MLYRFKCMQQSGDLSETVPIYVDGKSGIACTKLCLEDGLNIKEEMRDFMPQNVTYVTKESRPFLLQDKGKKIILTTSGMGTNGPARTHIPAHLEREETLIQFTGYTPKGTLGYQLKHTTIGEIIPVFGILTQRNAMIQYTEEFSSHAKADEMIDFLKQFTNPKLIAVGHGETETKKIFANKVQREVKPKNTIILNRDNYFRINPYGIVKSIPAKLM